MYVIKEGTARKMLRNMDIVDFIFCCFCLRTMPSRSVIRNISGLIMQQVNIAHLLRRTVFNLLVLCMNFFYPVCNRTKLIKFSLFNMLTCLFFVIFTFSIYLFPVIFT